MKKYNNVLCFILGTVTDRPKRKEQYIYEQNDEFTGCVLESGSQGKDYGYHYSYQRLSVQRHCPWIRQLCNYT